MKNFVFSISLVVLSSCTFVGCKKNLENTNARQGERMVISSWYGEYLILDRYSPGQRPPVSARTFAYISIAAWEAAVPAGQKSVAGMWKGALRLPEWTGEPHEFVVEVALNAVYSQMSKYFFPHALNDMRKNIEQKNQEYYQRIVNKYKADAVIASKMYGEAVADSVYSWAMTDTVGHFAFLYNYDKGYVPPAGIGLWQPAPSNQMPALLPHWGKSRTFVVHVEDVQVSPPPPYSEKRDSKLFSEAIEVFNANTPPLYENAAIAEFWSDDFPGLTFSSSTRWIAIATQVADEAKMNVAARLLLYLKASLAINDAAVITWNEKYRYNVERPESYINRVINADWKPMFPAPSFPAYPSGHAVFSACSAEVFLNTCGKQLRITDRCHEGRKEFASTPRTFHTFDEMVQECSYSRIVAGVHFRMDCEVGMQVGKRIAQMLNERMNPYIR